MRNNLTSTWLAFRAAVLSLLLLGLSGGGALADTAVDLGSFTAPTSVSLSNTVSLNGAFTDSYSFSVTSDSSLAGLLASVSFMNIVGISDFVASLWLGDVKLADGVTTTTSDGGISQTTSFINYSPLLAGPPPTYEIRASGTVFGGSGSYGGNLVLSPVPEPEIYATLALGVAVMGWAARRRSKSQT